MDNTDNIHTTNTDNIHTTITTKTQQDNPTITTKQQENAKTIQKENTKINNTKKINTKNEKTTNKEIKKDSEINYYVSNNGSDDNTGSETNPFKTIQTAINKTDDQSTYNIYITAGTYKGVGNTNLTVNGNHKINFIGAGINQTILDGEVNYTVGGGSVWGADEY